MTTRQNSSVFLVCLALLVTLVTAPAQAQSSLEKRQAKQREYFHEFINGKEHSLARAAFCRALACYSECGEAQEVLAKEVPSLSAQENFKVVSQVFSVLNPDGTLCDPPPMLVDDRSAGSRGAGCEFADCWFGVAAAIRNQRSVSWSQISALHSALADWESTLPAETNSFAEWSARRHAREYLRVLRGLVEKVSDPERCESLAIFLNDQFSYQGGTVGGLVNHLLDNRLTVNPGSAAHKYLAELARALDKPMSNDHQQKLQSWEQWRYKRQSAASNSSEYSNANSRSNASSASYNSATWTWPSYRTFYYWVPSTSYRTYWYRTPSTTTTYTYH